MHLLTGTPLLALPPPPPLRLIKGDALSVLPTLPSRSAGLVLTDPPYLFGSMPRIQASAAGAIDGARIDRSDSLFAAKDLIRYYARLAKCDRLEKLKEQLGALR